MRTNFSGSFWGLTGRLVLGAGLAGFLTPSARAAVDPVKLFNAHVINGVGGYYDFTESSYSVLTNIVGAVECCFGRVMLVSDGQMGDLSYAGLPASSYLHLPGGDADDRPGYDVSPNVWAGSDKGTSALFSFSALGILNPRGSPPAHQTYVGSDMALAQIGSSGMVSISAITPGGAPAFVYGAQNVRSAPLRTTSAGSDVVVFSKSAPTASNLGDGSVVIYNYGWGITAPQAAIANVVTERDSVNRTKNPIGVLATMDSDIRVDILVGDRQDSPPLKWFKNPLPFPVRNIDNSDYRPVNVADADVFHPAAVWAGKYDTGSFTDILVARDGAGADRRLTLLQGTDGTGTNFTVKHITGFPWAASALAVADFDGDGRNDVVSGMFPGSDPQPSPVTIFFPDAGYNTWTPQPLPRGGLFTGTLLDVQVGDLNGDGKPDVVALFSGEGPDDAGYRSRGLSSNVHVWINRNTGGTRNQWFDFGLAEPALPAAASGSSGGSLLLKPRPSDPSGPNQYMSVLRVAQKCPAVWFENRYHFTQEFRIRTTTGRGRNRQTTTFITDKYGNIRRRIEGTR